jgi:hypothetical protein
MNPDILIHMHVCEIQLRILCHKHAAALYDSRDRLIGYPTTILSSFTTSAIMLSLSNNSDELEFNYIEYVSLGLSIASFLFNASRDYLNFSKKFQSHDLSSKLYTSLLRSVEIRLINKNIDDAEKRDIYKDIVDQMSIIEKYELIVPKHIDLKVRMADISDKSNKGNKFKDVK